MSTGTVTVGAAGDEVSTVIMPLNGSAIFEISKPSPSSIMNWWVLDSPSIVDLTEKTFGLDDVTFVIANFSPALWVSLITVFWPAFVFSVTHNRA